MTKSRAVILAVLICSPTVAGEVRPRTAAPQPRVRLDPNSLTAIPDPKKEAKKESSTSVVTMNPVVVKSTAITDLGPPQEPQPTGPFSLLEGGWIVRKDVKNGMRVEVGAWPYNNILWKEDRFKSDLKHVGTEFVRVTW
jgi:hypothetical protein